MKLSKAIEGYKITKLAEGYSQNTMNGYQTHFDQFMKYVGDIEIGEISQDQVRQFIVFLRDEYIPQRKSGDKSPYRTTTIRNAWCAVRSLFNWASQELDIERPDLNLKKPKVTYPEVVPYTQEEIRNLLSACDYEKEIKIHDRKPFRRRRQTAIRDRLLILVLLDTGIRVSECASLRIKDVNMESGEIFIQPLRASSKNKSRTLRIGKATRRIMWRYLTEREDAYPDDYLFFTLQDRPMGRSSIRHVLVNIAKNAGVKNVYPHRFRHTFAIQFLRNGGDVFSLQQSLGHTDWAMTRHYSNLAQSDLNAAHRRASPVDNWRL